MRKLFLIISILFIVINTSNAQRYLEAEVVFPDTGVLGSIHYDFYGVSNPISYVTYVSNDLNAIQDTIFGSDINNIDSTVKFFITYAVDTNTFDTLGMIFITPGYSSYYSIGNTFNHNIVFNSINNTSASYLCNGNCDLEHIHFLDSAGLSDITYLLKYNFTSSQTYDSVYVSDLNLSGLCAGKYMIEISGDIFKYYSTTFYIDPEIISTPVFTINAQTYSSSNQVTCNGSAKAFVSGGIAPYYYSWDNGTFDINDSINDLCVGLHSLSVVDANNDSVAINFAIADSLSTFINPNNTGSSVVDTLFYTVENCDINYSIPVDSAFVSNLELLDTNLLLVECEIWQNASVTTTSDTINCNVQGVNYIEITFYCNNIKSNASVIKITDYINTDISNDITNNNSRLNIDIYPNPSSGTFTIKSNNIIRYVEITDLSGQIISQNNVSTNQLNINFNIEEKGVYLIKIQTNTNSLVKKIIIK